MTAKDVVNIEKVLKENQEKHEYIQKREKSH